MILSISWKNIWRNKTRSLVILIAITLGLLAGVFSVGVMMGMVEQRVESAIHNEVSHVQIHHPKFLENDEMEYTINKPEEIKNALQNIDDVAAISGRLKINAMANTSGNSSGVTILGVHPEAEKQVTDIDNNIIQNTGSFFEDDRTNQIVIGEKLADKLNLVNYKITDETLMQLKNTKLDDEIIASLDSLKGKTFRSEEDFVEKLTLILGEKKTSRYERLIKNHAEDFRTRSKIVLTFQDTEGNLTGGAFRVAGIFHIDNSAFEERMAFVQYDDLARIAGFSENAVHEIAVLANKRAQSSNIASAINDSFPGVEARIWTEIQPDLALTTEYIELSYYIIIIFILLALAFGIINTMLMAVLERIKELGMLMAIGMNRLRVFGMIMLETVYLTLTGAIIGMAIGQGLIQFFAEKGIDLSMYAEGFEAIGYGAVIYPEITLRFYLGVTLLVVATGIMSSIYPAMKALRLNPVEATRIE